MLARNQISNAIMINVDYLNFGKLISGADGFGSAPQGLGVTSRSVGLKPEHDGELRLNTLLDVQVFSPSMIDTKMADKGLLLVRTLPGTPTAPRGRTVFVRARFRQEGSNGADSRPHQQASIWVVGTDMWSLHPAPILAKIGKELEAEPDRADNNQRFGVPAKVVALDVDYPSGENSTNEKWRYAYYCILDLLLPKVADIGPRDQEITFGSDIFDTEADFLALVGGTLRDLPPGFDRWKDIRIGSGLRATGGLSIRYLPTEANTVPIDISDRIGSIKSRRDRLSPRGTKAVLPTITTVRPAADVIAPVSRNPVGEILADAKRSLQTNQPLTRTATPLPDAAMSNPKDIGSKFQADLIDFRGAPSEASAQQLVQTARQVVALNARKQLELMDHHETLDAIMSVLQPPPRSLPLGTLYDRVLLVSRLPWSPYFEDWLVEFWLEISRLGVLLPAERKRLDGAILERTSEDLRKTYNNSRELELWFRQVETSPGDQLSSPDLAFLKYLRRRLKALGAALDWFDVKGINNKVMIRGHFLLDKKELLDTHVRLMHCLAANLENTLERQKSFAERELRGDDPFRS